MSDNSDGTTGGCSGVSRRALLQTMGIALGTAGGGVLGAGGATAANPEDRGDDAGTDDDDRVALRDDLEGGPRQRSTAPIPAQSVAGSMMDELVGGIAGFLAVVGGYAGVRLLGGEDTDEATGSSTAATDASSGSSASPASTASPSAADSGSASPAASDPAATARPPTDLDLSDADYDEFDVGGRIGTGGNAVVDRATITRDGTAYEVALKTPLVADAETIDRAFYEEFAEEAAVWARIDDHEHIVSVYGWGSQPVPWIALEYVPSGNLNDVAGALSSARKLDVLGGLCEGVHHAHRHGITHTDIKPENALVAFDSDRPVAKVADWGLATVLLEHSTSVQGLTPMYAAPEQFDPDGYGGTDDRTDIYQLGVVAYELLTGRLPYEADTHAATMNAVLNESPTPPTEVAPELPAAVDDALLPALAKAKDDRYDTPLYLRDALEEVSP